MWLAVIGEVQTKMNREVERWEIEWKERRRKEEKKEVYSCRREWERRNRNT